MKKLQAYKVYILLALCVLFWSGNFVLGRFIKDDIQPLELAFFRWCFTFILLLPLTIKYINIKKCFLSIKNNFKILSILAILGITLFNTIVYLALKTTQATNALLINSIIPLLILILAHFILKSYISKMQILGIFVSTFGVIFLVLKGDFSTHIQFHQGDFWIILSSITWASYSIFVKFKPKDLNHVELFISLVFLGLLYLTPLYFFQGYEIQREIYILKQYWPFFLYVSFFASILSFYFWNFAIEQIGAERTGQFTHLMPVFGAILAYIFLGETLEFYHIFGAIFIAIGIYLSLFLSKKI
ncbi:EamA family transporter [Malaciobacter mytili]|uniref:DMT family transporter n=1 Tax=Malaciobacter mytili TaxID=603050 RepID=UPI00100ACC78|nr:DMT family transporter [Malaciobacter mytili]RXI42955.1 EamA family transporter [Malaciobacter mytili]